MLYPILALLYWRYSTGAMLYWRYSTGAMLYWRYSTHGASRLQLAVLRHEPLQLRRQRAATAAQRAAAQRASTDG